MPVPVRWHLKALFHHVPRQLPIVVSVSGIVPISLEFAHTGKGVAGMEREESTTLRAGGRYGLMCGSPTIVESCFKLLLTSESLV